MIKLKNFYNHSFKKFNHTISKSLNTKQKNFFFNQNLKNIKNNNQSKKSTIFKNNLVPFQNSFTPVKIHKNFCNISLKSEELDPNNACIHIFSPPLKLDQKSNKLPQDNPLKIAVKDVIDIAGFPTTAGCPSWRESTPIPKTNAPIIQTILENGHEIVCKTQTDELACSINGENIHYGTPINSRAKTRIPGGSSSGSAVCVRYSWIDLSFGTDTAGSCRIPAAYNGIYGFRSSFGSLNLKGILGLAPSFDTLGWFSDSPMKMLQMSRILLDASSQRKIKHEPNIKVAYDLFELADESISRANFETFRQIDRFQEITDFSITSVWNNSINNDPDYLNLSGLLEVSRILQETEISQYHKAFLETKPNLDPILLKKLNAFSSTTYSSETLSKLYNYKKKFSNLLNNELQDDIIVFPTIPGPAPKLGGKQGKDYRRRIFQLVNVSSISGFPCISVPSYVGTLDDEDDHIWSGLSVMSGSFTDISLLNFISQSFGNVY